MLKPLPEYAAGIKGKGKLSIFQNAILIDNGWKASQLKSNGLVLSGAGLLLPPYLQAVGDDVNIDLGFLPQGAGGWLWAQTLAGLVQGGVNSTYELNKTKTAMVDAAATTVFTVTVPNAAHAASIALILTGSLGAGGAVGAFEASATAYGQIVITRTAGLATVATAAALTSTGSAAVAGAATITLAYAVTAMTGANNATQTFNITVTITRGSGTSTNHQVVAEATLWNANASGITIA